MTLDSLIEVSAPTGNYTVHHPLLVFTPEGVSRWLGAGAIALTGYCASYDLNTLTQIPPADCLRAVAIGRLKAS